MTDVFISYSRRDKVFTQKLVDALQAANREVWADWASIPAASDWDAEIKEGIEKTNTVLFLLSPEWIKSNECRKEMVHAIQMGKRLVPILHIMPDQGQEVPPELAKLNWVYMRATDDFDKAFETLQGAMDTDLDWMKTHTRIQVRAIEWNKKNRDNSLTLRGNDLTEGEQFISQGTHKSPEPTELQGEFILASRKDATRRQRITLAGVTVALVVSIALGVAAIFQRQTAITQRNRADLNSQISFARELTASANNVLTKDPELSILLALQATDVLQKADQPILTSTEDALRLALQTSRLRYVVPANTRPDNTGAQTSDELFGLAFSPDGKLLATGSSNGKIKVWKFAHFPYPSQNQSTEAGTVWLEEAFNIPDAYDAVLSIAFSPDGKIMATSASSDPFTPALWDVQLTGKQLFELSGHKAFVNKIVFSHDGKLIATSSDDGEVIIWDAFNGQKKLTILDHKAPPANSNLSNEVRALAFSPDGKYLASGGLDNILIASDTQTGQTIYTFDTENSFVHTVAFSPDGKYLTYGSGRNTVVTFDFKTQQKAFTIRSHEHQVYTVAYSPDGKLLLSAAHDGTIIVSHALDGSEVFVLTGDKNVHISGATFSPDGKYIASVNYDGQMKIWDASPVATPEAGSFATSTSPILGLDYSPDGSRLAVANDQVSAATIWSLPLSAGTSISLVTNSWSTDVTFSPDGKTVATGSIWDGVNFWDATSGKNLHTFNLDDKPFAVAFSPDGKSLGFAMDGEQKAFIIDTNTGKQLNRLEYSTTPGSYDVAFSPDGKRLAAAYLDERIQVLDLADNTTLEYHDHEDWVTAVKFSPDGKHLLTGSMDGTAVLRDITANKIVFRFNVRAPVLDVAFSPDGSRAATASQDGTVKMWSIIDGSLLYTIPSSSASINKITFSPDGKFLAAGGADGLIRFYYVQNEDVLALAKARITRSLTDEECQEYLHEEKCPDTIIKPSEKTKPENLVPIKPGDVVVPVVNESANEPAPTNQPQPTATSSEVSETAGLKSGDGSIAVTLSLTNLAGSTIRLSWMNFEGGEEAFYDLLPNKSVDIADTYNTHAWRLRDSSGNLIFEYVATTTATQTITINADLTVTVK